MDIAVQNHLASYGVLERGLDLQARNLAARINTDIINIPAVILRRDYGDIQLLHDTKSCMEAVTITTCLPGGGSQPTDPPAWGGNGYNNDHNNGYNNGHNNGYDNGHNNGYDNGHNNGYDNSHNGYTTVYTTECIQVCPTETPCPRGTKTNTYTITETCSGDVADYTRPILPPDFTTVVTVCTVCEGKPTITVTCPNSEATKAYTAGSNAGYPAEAPVCEDCEEGEAPSIEGTFTVTSGGASDSSDSGESASDVPDSGAAAATSAPTGYVQAASASNIYAKTAAVLLGGALALTGWLL